MIKYLFILYAVLCVLTVVLSYTFKNKNQVVTGEHENVITKLLTSLSICLLLTPLSYFAYQCLKKK